MRKKNKVGGITIPDIKLYYKVTVIKTVWYSQKNRHIDQWNRLESPEINRGLYSQLILDKGGRSIKWRKNSLFKKWCWEIWTATCKKINKNKKNLHHQLAPYTHINLRLIKALNVSLDILKVLEERRGRNISDIPHSNIFTDMSPRARDIKERRNK